MINHFLKINLRSFILAMSLGHIISIEAQGVEYKPVLYLRTVFETLSNQGTIAGAGTATNFGGMNLIYFQPISPVLFAGFGYSSSFDITAKTLPITGYSFHGKWYFRGVGTTVIYKEDWGVSELRPARSYYAGGSYSYNTYYLGHDPASTQPRDNLTGQYSTVNAYVGGDQAINKKFSWNAEGGMSLLTMSASDDRIKVQSTFIYLGLSYIF